MALITTCSWRHLACGIGRAGHNALWNRSIALRSWANLDFGSDGAPWDKEWSALSELTKSCSERSALERFKEKRAPSFKERFQKIEPSKKVQTFKIQKIFEKKNNSSPKLTNTNTTFENLLSGKFGRGGACQKAYFSALETKPAM